MREIFPPTNHWKRRFHGQKSDVIVRPAGEFAAINAARIAGKVDNEIHHLVARLDAVRKECLR